MKHYFLLFALFVSTVCKSQEPLSFNGVIEVPNISQKELYGRAKLFLAETYKSSKDVIQADDIEIGQIIGKANFQYSPKSMVWGSVGGTVTYIVKIFVKDGKYKYDITNFSHDICGTMTTSEDCPCKFAYTKNMNNKIWADVKNDCKKESEIIIKALTTKMNKKSETDF